jgi:hypothetical protein
MVPHIPVIAMTVPETLPATSSIDIAAASQGWFAGGAAAPAAWRTDTRRARFDDHRASADAGWLETFEADLNTGAGHLDTQVRRAASGRPMQVADALRLRHELNTHTEKVMLCKKVSDALTNGLQTLARGN